jgi:hypothetical protein
MTDEQTGITRRQAIERTALAAGLVWSAPAIRSVHRVAAGGTPPPTSSSSSVPSTTTFTFSGAVTLPARLGPTDPACVENLDWHGPVDLSPFGQGNLALAICLGALDGSGHYPLIHATFDLSVSDGTVSGPSTSGTVGPLVSFPPPEVTVPFHIAFAINGGTGAYDGASGTANLDGTYFSSSDGGSPDQFIGDVAGTFDVPL